ncbi:MAG TPA: protease complex subunit PrcB family protein [Bryobacteraceae bacterium]|nr:protease complex subunit PrcB family protein [Bryobacteraceae bacterium]
MTQQISEEEVRRASAVKGWHERALMALPGVTGVGVGASRRRPGQAAILVYIGRPLSAEEGRLFPRSLEGVEVELVEGGPFQALGERTVAFSKLAMPRCPATEAPAAWVIHTRAAWRAFLAAAGLKDLHPRPDFRRSAVVLVSAGRRPTGGYAVEIERIVEAPGSKPAKVYYRIVAPSPDAPVPRVISYPCTAVEIPRKFRTVTFEPPLVVHVR